MVKVLPKNAAIRKLIKHPVGGPFRGEGPAEWPKDTFTARRIADGDVTVEQAEKKDDQPGEKKDEQQPVAEQPTAEQKEERASRSRR